MTATKVANTETTETLNDTPAVDVEVVSTGNDTAESDTTDESAPTKRDDQTVKAEMDAKRTETLDTLKAEHAQALETNGHYKDWGFVYAGAAPIANAIGGEIGFMQRDDKTNKVQRTGVGIYLRSDHIFSAKLDACNDRF